MLTDSPNIDSEQLRQQFLTQPDRLVRHTYLNAIFAPLSGEDQEFGGAIADLELFFQ